MLRTPMPLCSRFRVTVGDFVVSSVRSPDLARGNGRTVLISAGGLDAGAAADLTGAAAALDRSNDDEGARAGAVDGLSRAEAPPATGADRSSRPDGEAAGAERSGWVDAVPAGGPDRSSSEPPAAGTGRGGGNAGECLRSVPAGAADRVAAGAVVATGGRGRARCRKKGRSVRVGALPSITG